MTIRVKAVSRSTRLAVLTALALLASLTPSGVNAGVSAAGVAYYTDAGVESADLSGSLAASFEAFQFFSLNGNVLAGSKHLAGNRSERIVVHDATTGERLFKIEDAAAPVVIAGGKKIAFWPDRMANRDKYGSSIWMRTASGREHRILQLTGPRATMRDPFHDDGWTMGFAFDESGRTMAVAIGNDGWTFEYDVWVVDTKTRAATRITRGLNSRFPSVSPSGAKVALVREVDHCGGPGPGYRASDLRVMSATGADKQTLHEGSCDLYYTDPRWVSETELVAARLTKEGEAEYAVDLFKIDVSSGEITPLTTDGSVSYLTASASLGQVAFHRETDVDGFWLYDLATDEITQLPTGYIPHLSGENHLI